MALQIRHNADPAVSNNSDYPNHVCPIFAETPVVVMHLRQEVNPTSTNAKQIPEHCVVIYDLPFCGGFFKDDRYFHLLLYLFPIMNAE